MKCVHEIDDFGECGERATRFFIEKGTTLRRSPHGRMSINNDQFDVVGFCSRHVPYAIRPSVGEFMGGMREISAEEAAVWEVQDS